MKYTRYHGNIPPLQPGNKSKRKYYYTLYSIPSP